MSLNSKKRMKIYKFNSIVFWIVIVSIKIVIKHYFTYLNIPIENYLYFFVITLKYTIYKLITYKFQSYRNSYFFKIDILTIFLFLRC